MEKIIKIQSLIRGYLTRKKLFIISCKSLSNFLILNNEISPNLEILDKFKQIKSLYIFKTYTKSDLKTKISSLNSLIYKRKLELL
jgi:hypothetical protein